MQLISFIGNGLGRLMVSGFFFICGVYQIIYWQDVEMYVTNALTRWQTLLSFSEFAQNSLIQIIFFLPAFLILGTVFTLIGSLLFLLKIKEKLGAWMLLFFLIPQTIILNPFWFSEGNERETSAALFLRDCAIAGGLLLFISQKKEPAEDNEEDFHSMKFQ